MAARRDYVNLDLLRSTAVLLVLGNHTLKALGFFLSGSGPLVIWGVNELGRLGVLLFFIHTSLVLMMSLDRMDSRNESAIALRFYLRRLFRLYPLSIFMVLMAVAFQIPPDFPPAYLKPTAAHLWQNLLLVQNVFGAPQILGQLWTLPYEIQMYLFLPFLYMGARNIQSYGGVLVMLCSGFGAWYLNYRLVRASHLPFLLEFAPWFFMGVAAFGISRFTRRPMSATLYGFSLMSLIVCYCLIYHYIQSYRVAWAEWMLGIGFAFALPHFEEIRSLPLAACARLVARYSYGIYLAHVPVLWVAFYALSKTSWWVRVPVLLLLITAIPVLLYHGIEAPMIRLGIWLSESRSKPVLAASVP
jgi:peptidoglycan/LPS O-acetylase OafA/YrhL